ncbi:MAG: hypothetical protein M1826_004076 [Phylliscum demangeonii]|nr:MAG: hypothetical protein M1826_004076 [Phylliscum demangeonii]
MLSATLTTALVSAVAFSQLVRGHGHIGGVSNGTYFGSLGDFGGDKAPSEGRTVGWYPQTEGVYDPPILKAGYDDAAFVCGTSARAGPDHVTIAAGERLRLFWAGWGSNHRGAIFDYLAPCNGPCDQVANIQDLKFVKVGELGLVQPHVDPHPSNTRFEGDRHVGVWATDLVVDSADKTGPDNGESAPDHMTAYNGTWYVDIPKTLAPGFYVVRTEILALFGTGQYYPRCLNLMVTGDGTAHPVGVPASQLYNASESGVAVNFADMPDNYTLPGVPMWEGASQVNPNFASNNMSPPGPDIAVPRPTMSSAYGAPVADAQAAAPTATPAPAAPTMSSSSSAAADAAPAASSSAVVESSTAAPAPAYDTPTAAAPTSAPAPPVEAESPSAAAPVEYCAASTTTEMTYVTVTVSVGQEPSSAGYN